MFVDGLSSFTVHSITSEPINYFLNGSDILRQITAAHGYACDKQLWLDWPNFITLPVCQNGWLYANLRSGPILAAFIHSLLQRGRHLQPEFYLKSETKIEPDLRLALCYPSCNWLIPSRHSVSFTINLRKRTVKERRRQTLCDKRDNDHVWKKFRQTSLSNKKDLFCKRRAK